MPATCITTLSVTSGQAEKKSKLYLEKCKVIYKVQSSKTYFFPISLILTTGCVLPRNNCKGSVPEIQSSSEDFFQWLASSGPTPRFWWLIHVGSNEQHSFVLRGYCSLSCSLMGSVPDADSRPLGTQSSLILGSLLKGTFSSSWRWHLAVCLCVFPMQQTVCEGSATHLIFTAQGKAELREKMWETG